MIPIYGSFGRPGSPKEGLDEIIEGRVPWSGGKLNIQLNTTEFTSVCPTTGQPDFYDVSVDYVPDEYYLESKTMKFYFWAFRDQGFHSETLTKQICEDLFSAINPFSMKVKTIQSPRGGISIVSEYFKER